MKFLNHVRFCSFGLSSKENLSESIISHTNLRRKIHLGLLENLVSYCFFPMSRFFQDLI